MGRAILFWMSGIPDSDNITRPAWNSFLNVLAFLVIVAVVVGGLLIVAAYERAAKQKLIRWESDLFQPYTPLRYLWFCAVPAALVWLLGWYLYHRQFPEAASFLGGALGVGLYAGVLTLLFAYALMALTKATPPKFKYRPFFAVRSRQDGGLS